MITKWEGMADNTLGYNDTQVTTLIV